MYKFRLLSIIVASSFSYMFYYHTIPFLVYEDSELSNATNFFELINKDKWFQDYIKNSYYYPIGLAATLLCWLSDIFGRKYILSLSVLWNIVFCVFAVISFSPKTLIAVHIGMGANLALGLVQGYLLLCESIQKKHKKLLAGLVFGAWGISLFLATVLFKVGVHWKIIDLVPLILSLTVYFKLPNYFESPEYLASIEDYETADSVKSQIKQNQSNSEPAKPFLESIKGFKNYTNYIKDFGSHISFFCILWFNTVLFYNSLFSTKIQYLENFYNDSILAGLLLASIAGIALLNTKVDFWKIFFVLIVVSRIAMFLLYFTEDNGFFVKLLYGIACLGLVNEVYSVFYVTEDLTSARIKGKVFGMMIFLAICTNFLIKKLLFDDEPTRKQCLLVSLVTMVSAVPWYYLRNASNIVGKNLLLSRSSDNYELRPI